MPSVISVFPVKEDVAWSLKHDLQSPLTLVFHTPIVSFRQCFCVRFRNAPIAWQHRFDLSDDDFMRENANNGVWFPFVNDCHNAINDALSNSGLENPGAPGGRFGGP